MSRSPNALLVSAAALLAALLALPAAAGDSTAAVGSDLERPSSRDAATLRRSILEQNRLDAAEAFLADSAAQDAVKAADPSFYQRVFARAAELKDMKGLLTGAVTVQSIRLGILHRDSCAFCLDPIAFPIWARANVAPSDLVLGDMDKAMWSWETMSRTQQNWVKAQKKAKAWPDLGFIDRNETMRAWAKFERESLLKLNPADASGVSAYAQRAYAVSEVLGSHETTAVWHRWDQLNQAAVSLASARARLAMSNDPKQKALLLEATNAATPEARLAALSKIFENLGERDAALLTAAPPRDDQKFTADTRKVIGAMLKTALMKETEGTFAGDDLKEFYAKTPLEVAFTTTSMSALGWYQHGGDTLFFNERYVEEYLKANGASVEGLMRDPALLQNLARIFASTFVHEAQHHRQDVWARDHKLPRMYHQGDEVEAFQADSLFMMQKMKTDPKFAAWATEAAKTNSVVAGDLVNARRMEEQGPEFFDRYIPNTHYPEVLSNEGRAWCMILWHNSVGDSIAAELKRRDGLTAAQRAGIEAKAQPLRQTYESEKAYRAALLQAPRKALEEFLKNFRSAAENDARSYNMLRARQESVAATTMERYKMLESGGGGRTEQGIRSVPSPVADKETP